MNQILVYNKRFGKNRMTSDISYEAKWKLLQDVAL